MKTMTTQYRLRSPLQGKQPKTLGEQHPGQAKSSSRKRGRKRLRREPTATQIAEGLALRAGLLPINYGIISPKRDYIRHLY